MLAGINAPRVVVRPPNVPAPPPISLLTQGNVVTDDSDVIDPQGAWRWEGGGGTAWIDPIIQTSKTGVWQDWPDNSGTATTDKRGMYGSKLTEQKAAGVSVAQRPFIQVAEITQGALAEFALRNAIEGSVDVQITRALDALAARTIEAELWTSAVVDAAQWDTQFRLKRHAKVTTVTTTDQPYLLALALAEQAAADAGFLDSYGGAYIHVPVVLFSLLMSYSQHLSLSPSGRQVRTPSGCMLVPEPGANGTWGETGDAWIEAKPGGATAHDNLSGGWLFVSPPVRVRLGSMTYQTYESNLLNTNDYTIVAERAVTIEASTVPNTLAVPVDYTTES